MTNPAALLLRGAIRVYQWVLAPVLGANCRYLPSCSEYAHEAIGVHGPVLGLWLAVCRLARCHPWGGCGYDPVPPRSSQVPCHHSMTPANGVPPHPAGH
jgi:uncharacterized protein